MGLFINVISAIGNNSSVYPLLVRDCMIEVPTKVIIARKENLKESEEIANEATRERLIDEYGTSAVWLGGVPLVEWISKKIIAKKGYNTDVNLKLFENDKYQNIDLNIKNFENKNESKELQQAIADLKKVKNNRKVFEKMIATKFAAAVIIPTAIMGFILPPLNFALTRKLREKRQQKLLEENKTKALSFKGGFYSTVANLTTDTKMAMTDGGLTVGRVTTSRNKEEAYVNAFRMLGSMFLNFVAPKYIAQLLDLTANKLFKINVKLDPVILDDKEFIEAIKNKNLPLPEDNTKSILEFIDKKPNSIFSKMAEKIGIVSYLSGKDGQKIRDPRKFVNIESTGKISNIDNLKDLRKEIISYMDLASKSSGINNFAQKAKFVKCGNILANVGISSFLLAVMLPKAQYAFNKLITGSYTDPGLRKKD